MLTLPLVVSMIGLHFIADFILQSQWMAENKSKRLDALTAHCVIYGLCFLVPFGIVFAGVNAGLHFAVDFVTSRITATLWQKQQWHWFFVVIGADQFIHYSCLFGTHELLR